jgi:tRNA(Ile)-lysidine synthetase-like protein
MARREDDYWRRELEPLLPRLVRQGKPTRSGRSATGAASHILALDLGALRKLPQVIQAMVLQKTAEQFGMALEFKHIQALTEILRYPDKARRLCLPHGLSVSSSLRELRFSLQGEPEPTDYLYPLPIPGEVRLPELRKTIRAQVISALPQQAKTGLAGEPGKQTISGYTGSLLNRTLLAPELTVRNWRAGDRFFPAHSQSPKKVKELLQPSRLGTRFSPIERKLWPVIESAGEIVWIRGFPVAQAFAVQSGEAVLIEEISDDS